MNNEILSLSTGIDNLLLPSWVLGQFIPYNAVRDRHPVGMLSIKELKTRLVSQKTGRVVPVYRDDTGKEFEGTPRDMTILVDKLYMEHPEKLTTGPLPIVVFPNLREWVNYRFSLTGGIFHLGCNIQPYAEAMSLDDQIKYSKVKKGEIQIPAASGDVAYFTAWVSKHIWKIPTYLVYAVKPTAKVYCISQVAGRWNPVYIRSIEGHTVDENYTTIHEFIQWLKVHPCAKQIAWAPVPDEGEDLVWLPYNKNYFMERNE